MFKVQKQEGKGQAKERLHESLLGRSASKEFWKYLDENNVIEIFQAGISLLYEMPFKPDNLYEFFAEYLEDGAKDLLHISHLHAELCFKQAELEQLYRENEDLWEDSDVQSEVDEEEEEEEEEQEVEEDEELTDDSIEPELMAEVSCFNDNKDAKAQSRRIAKLVSSILDPEERLSMQNVLMMIGDHQRVDPHGILFDFNQRNSEKEYLLELFARGASEKLLLRLSHRQSIGLYLHSPRDGPHHHSTGDGPHRHSTRDGPYRQSAQQAPNPYSALDSAHRKSTLEAPHHHSALDSADRKSTLEAPHRHLALDSPGRHSALDSPDRYSAIDPSKHHSPLRLSPLHSPLRLSQRHSPLRLSPLHSPLHLSRQSIPPFGEWKEEPYGDSEDSRLIIPIFLDGDDELLSLYNAQGQQIEGSLTEEEVKEILTEQNHRRLIRDGLRFLHKSKRERAQLKRMYFTKSPRAGMDQGCWDSIESEDSEEHCSEDDASEQSRQLLRMIKGSFGAKTRVCKPLDKGRLSISSPVPLPGICPKQPSIVVTTDQNISTTFNLSIAPEGPSQSLTSLLYSRPIPTSYADWKPSERALRYVTKAFNPVTKQNVLNHFPLEMFDEDD